MFKKKLTGMILFPLIATSSISTGYAEDEVYTGYATVFTLASSGNGDGIGNCGFGSENRHKYVIALNQGTEKWQFNDAKNCGRYVSITNPTADNNAGRTVIAEVVDSCEITDAANAEWCTDTAESYQHIDLDEDLATALGHPYGSENVKMTWKYIDFIPSDAPNGGKPYAVIPPGQTTSQYYAPVMPVNTLGSLPTEINWKTSDDKQTGTAKMNSNDQSSQAWYAIDGVDLGGLTPLIQVPGQTGYYEVGANTAKQGETMPVSDSTK